MKFLLFYLLFKDKIKIVGSFKVKCVLINENPVSEIKELQFGLSTRQGQIYLRLLQLLPFDLTFCTIRDYAYLSVHQG